MFTEPLQHGECLLSFSLASTKPLSWEIAVDDVDAIPEDRQERQQDPHSSTRQNPVPQMRCTEEYIQDITQDSRGAINLLRRKSKPES